VDIEFMRRKLEAFIYTANRSEVISRHPQEDFSMHSELRKQEYAVKQVLKALQPGLEDFSLNDMSRRSRRDTRPSEGWAY
jgi:hypothetical protein